MVIAIDFSMFDTTNAKLLKSADTLESALAQLGKNASSGIDKNPSDQFTPSVNAGNGFDEWLAADLSLSLSSDESSITSSPFSTLENSPVLGFDSFGSAVGPPLFEIPMNSFPSVSVANELPVSPVEIKSPVLAPTVSLLTSAAVQQAAAALNIPWSPALESAVMAQAALGAAIAAVPVPQSQFHGALSPILTPKVEPEEKGPGSPVSTPVASCSPATPAHTPVTRGKGSKKRQLSFEEEVEEIVAKRAKNTDAARRSRLKKLIKLEGLEAKVSDLEAANNALNMKIAILKTEKNGFIAKDVEQTARIAQLEAQLAEAHAALTNRATAPPTA
ncbi:hypothetical protein BGZ65_009705 [Modicella reniformis]|uniref:BZIP domain-containing protein n=1 Tax=Modicella reniformis TaxID=1440133 RepID=A0A9P6M7Z7_9FUNG|nr:hypothetical protein BGZ65_009705 [Modicella reniformis]